MTFVLLHFASLPETEDPQENYNHFQSCSHFATFIYFHFDFVLFPASFVAMSLTV
jgi:hypothetical protein